MAKDTNIRNLHTKFLDQLREKGRSNSTIIAYGKDIEQLIELLEGDKIEHVHHVKNDHLQTFKTNLEGANYTNKSISRKINSIRTFYRYLIENSIVQDNISTSLEHPKVEILPPRVLSEIEYRALRDACRNEERLYSIVELLLQTGLRIGELTRMELDDINLDASKGPLEIKVHAFGSHPERVVPLNTSATNALKIYMNIRPESDNPAIFVTKTGNPLLVRNIRTSIDRAFKKAGIKDAKVNDLRNTFIAHHLAKGTNLVAVSKLVGHKRISTTEKYLGLVEETGGKGSVKLEEL